MAAAVPSQVINNLEYTDHFSAEEAKEIVDKTGILQRRFANDNTCSSDLCYAAASKLLNDMNIPPESLGVLIFVSQTPDYRMPATSVLLQDRLGLPTSIAAFDINLGCSAFVYGLSVAFSMLHSLAGKNILLLVGETRSRVYSAKDRKTAFLFGDGGTASLIGVDDKFGESFFSLGSDGSKESYIKVDAGGYRNPSSPETMEEKVVDEHGNIRSLEHGYMNGADVFSFVITTIPKEIKSLFSYANVEKDDIDYFLLHQANAYMNNYLLKKMKIDPEKAPVSLDKFGNTSSVSIPLTMVSSLKDNLQGNKKLLLSGFGVGMSWGSAIINTVDTKISTLVEV